MMDIFPARTILFLELLSFILGIQTFPLIRHAGNPLDHMIVYPINVTVNGNESEKVDSPDSWRDVLEMLAETKNLTVGMEFNQTVYISRINILWNVCLPKIHSIKVASTEVKDWSFSAKGLDEAFVNATLDETVMNETFLVVMLTEYTLHCIDEQGMLIYGPDGNKIDMEGIKKSDHPSSLLKTIQTSDPSKASNEIHLEVTIRGPVSIEHFTIKIKGECLGPDIYLSIGDHGGLKSKATLGKMEGDFTIADFQFEMPRPVEIDKYLNFDLDASHPIGEWRIDEVHLHGATVASSSFPDTTSSDSQPSITATQTSTDGTHTPSDPPVATSAPIPDNSADDFIFTRFSYIGTIAAYAVAGFSAGSAFIVFVWVAHYCIKKIRERYANSSGRAATESRATNGEGLTSSCTHGDQQECSSLLHESNQTILASFPAPETDGSTPVGG